MLRSVLHILLALNILASSVGVTIFERACNMEGRKIASWAVGDTPACGHEVGNPEAVPSCCAKARHQLGRTQLNKSNCCDVKALSLKGQTNAPLRTAENSLAWTVLQVTPAWAFVLALPAGILARDIRPLARRHPLPNGQAIRIRFQSFRC
jgi:hypothetical protein